MHPTNLRKLLIIFIVILAGFLRLYSLNDYPVSLYWDEAAQGYNAYSISKTGKDEFGKTLPLLFRSFDDNKMPVNIYLTTVATRILGLNELSTRLPSAIAGTLTVLFTILLTELLLIRGKYTFKNHIFKISLATGFLLAISPWHIQFSRAAFEANIALTFIVSGIYLLLKIKPSKFDIYLSFLLLILAFYSYRSVIVFLPIFLISTVFIFKDHLYNINKKHFLTASVFLIIAVIPLIYVFSIGEGDKRASQVSIFSSLQEEVVENSKLQESEGNTLWAKVKYNRRLLYAKHIVINYLSHYKPNFLFLDGDGNARHTIKGMGVMYKWEIPFFITGIFVLYYFIKEKKVYAYLIIWFLIAPFPASLSLPAPHALRSLLMLPVPQIFTASAIVFFISRFKGNIRIFICILLSLVILLTFINYTKSYKSHMIQFGDSWGDGYKQLVNKVENLEINYDKVMVTGEMWEPYIYFLYYLKYDPQDYQKNGTSINFSKYIFGGTSWDLDKKRRSLLDYDIINMSRSEKILVVLTPEELKETKFNYKVIGEIRNRFDKIVFVLLELN